MTRDASEHSAEALRRQREQVRRALVRANTAGLAIMVVVLALALAAIGLAFRSERHAGQAEYERQRAEEELWRASLAQARAQRLTGQMGQRVFSLEGVRAAARWRPSLAVREEAIAALALPDLETESSHTLLTNAVSLAVDADFTRFAVANDQGQTVVRRLADGALVATLTNEIRGAPSMGFSPDGSLLAIKLRQEFAVWTVATRERLWSVQDAPPGGWNRLPAFSADGAFVAIPIRSGGLRILEARTGRIRHVLPEAMASGVLAFHPRTNWLAVGAERTVQVWDYEASKVVVSLASRRNNVPDVTWRPDGRWLALGSDDGSAYLWNVRTGEEIACTGHSREGVRVGLRPQGDLLASYAWDRTLRLWDAGSGAQVLQTQLGEPLRFSANGERLAVFRRPNRLEILRVFPPRECRLLTLPPRSRSVLSALEFSPDSQHLAVGNHEGLTG